MANLHLAFYKVIVLSFVFCTLQDEAKGDFKLTLLHTNDCHARFEEFTARGARCEENEECFGGVARRATILKEIRQKEANVLLVDGGDQYQGTVWFYVYRGRAASRFMHLLEYDAMALGNHEFDRGVEGLVPFLKNATFPVLSCNIDASNEPSMTGLFRKFTVLEVGGQKVGVVGYTTQETPDVSETGKLVFNDVISSVQAVVNRLQEAGINKIIAVGHAGIEADLDIGAHVTGVDIVVGGHTNTFLYTGTPPSGEIPMGGYPQVRTQSSGDKALVVQDYAFGKYLGHLQVTFNDAGHVKSWQGNPILLDSSVEKDPVVEAEVTQWAASVDQLYQNSVGHTQVLLDGARTSCRLKECSMGNFIADAAVYHHLGRPSNTSWSGAAIALLNGGSMRASIEKGNITIGDILNVQPFGNTLDLIEIQGRYIRAALEYSVEDYDVNAQNGKFLQMSGLRVKYDLSKPNGQRVVDVKVICLECDVPQFTDLDPEKTYKVIMSSFLVGGGDGYDMFPDHLTEHHIFGDMDVDILIEYIEARTPIIAGMDGRIQFVDGNTCLTGRATGLVTWSKAAILNLAILILIVVNSLMCMKY